MRPGDPASPLVNTNADYWTRLVGIAWDRDVDIDFDREPVDLDGDGKPDTTVTRHVHAKGGILANPELFGLTPTPDDPRGRRRARVGLDRRARPARAARPRRQADRPDRHDLLALPRRGQSRPAARSCSGCPGVAFDYGLLLATAAVLDDGNAAAAEDRRAHGFPLGTHGARAPACWRAPAARI